MKDHKEYPFISSLEGLRDAKDRAALAKLRRGLGRKMGTPEMFPYVVPYLPDAAWEHKHYFLIASLFAMHPLESPRGISLGVVFRKVWLGNNQSESIEKRFTNLLSADSDDMGGHLRHAISLVKSHKVSIDYHQLFYDLRYWDHPDRFVQLDWARDFWGGANNESNENTTKGEKK